MPINPIATPSSAPAITSRRKCSPRSTLATDIRSANTRITTPSGSISSIISVPIRKAENEWREGNDFPIFVDGGSIPSDSKLNTS